MAEEVKNRKPGITHVVIDEVQRVPELLNEVHALIEESDNPPYFCMSGSSARKLKRGKANLLAGRVWTYNLHPLTHMELNEKFYLNKALEIGTLPSVYLRENNEEALNVLHSYVNTYLKEEIEQEALVRDLDGFLDFLHLAGDENGNIINFSSISRKIGVHNTTIREYFRVLEDTLIGFLLYPYTSPSRSRLAKHPKFYLFDTGIQRAIINSLGAPLIPETSAFGRTFEHFVILEFMRISSCLGERCRFFFYRSAAHAEVDLIIEKPNKSIFAIEIKADDDPGKDALRGLKSFSRICPEATLILASLAPNQRKIGDVLILPWKEAINHVFPALED